MTGTESSSFPSKDWRESSSTDRKQPSFGEARGCFAELHLDKTLVRFYQEK